MILHIHILITYIHSQLLLRIPTVKWKFAVFSCSHCSFSLSLSLSRISFFPSFGNMDYDCMVPTWESGDTFRVSFVRVCGDAVCSDLVCH